MLRNGSREAPLPSTRKRRMMLTRSGLCSTALRTSTLLGFRDEAELLWDRTSFCQVMT